MTTTITIKDKAVNATYQNVTGLTGGTGDDAIDGGDGSDTAVLAGNYSNYSFKYDSITKKYWRDERNIS